MNISANTLAKLVRQSEKAAKIAVRNRFLIETYLSAREALAGKTRVYKSAKELFQRLGI